MQNWLRLNKLNPFTSEPLSIWPRLWLIAGSSFLLGAVTYLGKFMLRNPNIEFFFLSSVVWMLVTFFISATMPSIEWAILAGFGMFFAGGITYRVIETIRAFFIDDELSSYRSSLDIALQGFISSLIWWGIISLITGPMLGIAGYWWHVPKLNWQAVSIGLLSGIFAAESIILLLTATKSVIFDWLELIVGLVLPLLLGRTLKSKLYSYPVLVIVTLVCLGVFWYINSALDNMYDGSD